MANPGKGFYQLVWVIGICNHPLQGFITFGHPASAYVISQTGQGIPLVVGQIQTFPLAVVFNALHGAIDVLGQKFLGFLNGNSVSLVVFQLVIRTAGSVTDRPLCIVPDGIFGKAFPTAYKVREVFQPSCKPDKTPYCLVRISGAAQVIVSTQPYPALVISGQHSQLLLHEGNHDSNPAKVFRLPGNIFGTMTGGGFIKKHQVSRLRHRLCRTVNSCFLVFKSGEDLVIISGKFSQRLILAYQVSGVSAVIKKIQAPVPTFCSPVGLILFAGLVCVFIFFQSGGAELSGRSCGKSRIVLR